MELAGASGIPAGVDRLDELERERQLITAELAGSQGMRGRSRKLGDEKDLVRNRVCNAIRRAIKHIAKEDAPLAAHLRRPVLNLGHTISDVPRGDITWAIEG